MATSPAAAGSGEWQPDQNNLGAIVRLLQSTTSPDNAVQQQVMSAIAQFKQNPEFARYLSFVLASCTDQQVRCCVWGNGRSFR